MDDEDEKTNGRKGGMMMKTNGRMDGGRTKGRRDEEADGRNFVGQGPFVADCVLDSDLEMYFPDTYVPNDSERMLLYRELDNIRDDKEMEAYKRRMVDRFGKMPKVGEELLQVVPLRRLG